MTDKIVAALCETLADCKPSLRFLKLTCDKLAVGRVTSPDGYQHTVCEGCAQDYEARNAHVADLKKGHTTLRDGGIYEVTRW